MEKLIFDLKLQDFILLPGFVANPEQFYNLFDLFVLTSDYEGFGNVVLEALSYGLRIVSTDCPSGPREILEDGKWGALVPMNDVFALTRAMENALASEKIIYCDEYLDKFSIDEIGNRYIKILSN